MAIENLDWRECLRRYDRPHTLFYIDPPYYGVEDYYGKGVFSREDYAEMAGLLATLQGRFMLSLNDRPEVREIFGAFEIEIAEVTTRYSVNVLENGGSGIPELLIGNAARSQ